ncbi:hypothetical protein F2P56_021054 [Juglans regia]|uniref:Uncharacterized protein LOC108992127 n=2 Tax=Juglans regia TaxID=51240 RepID=A0A2I4ERW7_JUGRE|nr:uncharacterized protein LOC108992127 [Juglans regia]KAF5461241.1 hypothetical protein F2P56_021054 [Juglans regia]
MVGLTTSNAVWTSIEKFFSTNERAWVMTTRLQLAALKKGNNSISKYYHKVKSYSDSFTASGQPLNDLEYTYYLLGGLDSSYESLVTSILTRVDLMPVDEIYNHLLTQELRFQRQQSTVDMAVSSANVATRGDSSRGPPSSNSPSHNNLALSS